MHMEQHFCHNCQQPFIACNFFQLNVTSNIIWLTVALTVMPTEYLITLWTWALFYTHTLSLLTILNNIFTYNIFTLYSTILSVRRQNFTSIFVDIVFIHWLNTQEVVCMASIYIFQLCNLFAKFEMFVVFPLASTFPALNVYKFHTASTLWKF